MAGARKLTLVVGLGLGLIIAFFAATRLPRLLTWRELDRTYAEEFAAPASLAPSLAGKSVLRLLSRRAWLSGSQLTSEEKNRMATYDYDLLVIGAGQGGLPAAHMAANLGARVALIESAEVGGT